MTRFLFSPLLPILLVALVSVACDNKGGGDSFAPPSTPTPTSGEITADIYDGDLPDLNIYVGTRVRWRNLGDIAHNVTTKDGTVNTGVIEEGQRTAYILFSKSGVMEYFDNLNPSMEGRIQVFDRN